MADNKSAYSKALGNWDNLVEAETYSVPPDAGDTAVMLPFNHAYHERHGTAGESFNELAHVAHDIADVLKQCGTEVQVALDAKPADFLQVLTDPHISSIVLLGHGCLSSVEIEGPAKASRLDWLDISDMSDHLKTGTFLHYSCGTLPRKLNVPLGLLAVSRHRNVWGAVGHRILASDIVPGDHAATLRPVTHQDRMTYGDIREQLPTRQLSISQRAHVAAGGLRNALLQLAETKAHDQH